MSPLIPSRRVLVIDDNEDSALGLTHMLEFEGIETQWSSDGPTGIISAKMFRPDVILLDLGLPVLNGFEVIQALRASADTADTRVAAVSGYVQREFVEASREAGFDAHFAKPVELQLLRAFIAGDDQEFDQLVQDRRAVLFSRDRLGGHKSSSP